MTVKIPSLCCHKATKRAVVRLNGKDHYLGRYGSKESKLRYRQLIHEWTGNGGQLPSRDEPPTVNEILLAYMEFVLGYYRKDGHVTSEVDTIRQAIRFLKELYGTTVAEEIGPVKLASVRQTMIERGLSRRFINKQIGRIVRVFKWAASRELLPAGIYEQLKTLEGLKAGRTEARETAPILPVAQGVIDATLEHLPRAVATMVKIQLLTAMRPAEVCAMRGCDLETSGTTWIYRPANHKTEHLGRQRQIFIGPRAQEVLKPWLQLNLEEYLFQPVQSEAARNAKRRAARQTPMTPSQGARRPKNNRLRPPGNRYHVPSYRRAIHRASVAAGMTPWSPNRLRHTGATAVRKAAGLEGAQVVLGHSHA